MEAAGLFCVAVWPFILLVILVASSIGATGGVVGLISDRRRRGRTWKISLSALIISLTLLLVCGLPAIFPYIPPPPTPGPVYKLTDEAVRPFLQAINQSNRLSLGFSPISSEAQVTIQDYGSTAAAFISIGPETDLDAHPHWSIYFVKEGNTYKWGGESETYWAPNRFDNISISYFTDSISPGDYNTRAERKPSNILVVEYRGEDPRLKKPNLTLEDVRPVLAEWKKAWARATPEK